MSPKNKVRLAWIVVEILIVLSVWLIGIRIGPIRFGQPSVLGETSLREVAGFVICFLSAVAMFALIYYKKFP